MAYSDTDKALVVATVERYGETTGLRFVKDNYALTPSRGTVHQWVRVQGVEASEEAREELSRIEQQRKARLQAEIEPRICTTLEAYDRALKADKALAAQQLARAAGILTDKLVPPPKAGVGTPLVGDANQVVNIIVAGSPNPPGTVHQDIPLDWEEGKVIEGESEPA